MKAAIYIRVSSDMQIDGYSLETQEEACKRVAERERWQVVTVYRDEGKSAKTVQRPAFQQMLSDAEMGMFDAILVHKLDRFSRSVTDMLLTMRDLERRKVAVKSATEDFDFTTPIGRVLLTLLAAFAEWYLANLSAEVKRNRKTAAMGGNWGSRLPFGYSPLGGWKKDGGNGAAIPDDNMAGYQMVMAHAATGDYSYRQLADLLNYAGYRPTGRAGHKGVELWTTDSLRSMVRNRFYTGEVRYRREWFPGNHEPLIALEQWQRVQEVMEGRQRTGAFKASTKARFYLLSGMVRCGYCGCPMRGEYRTNNADKEYQYYRCSSRYRRVECPKEPFVRVEVADSEIERLLNQFGVFNERAKENIRVISERLIEQTDSRKVNPDQSQRIKNHLERLRDLYELGDIDRAAYLVKREALQNELKQQQPVTPAHIRRAVTTMEAISEVWAIATPQEKRKLVRIVVNQVTIGERVTVQVRDEYAPYFA